MAKDRPPVGLVRELAECHLEYAAASTAAAHAVEAGLVGLGADVTLSADYWRTLKAHHARMSVACQRAIDALLVAGRAVAVSSAEAERQVARLP